MWGAAGRGREEESGGGGREEGTGKAGGRKCREEAE